MKNKKAIGNIEYTYQDQNWLLSDIKYKTYDDNYNKEYDKLENALQVDREFVIAHIMNVNDIIDSMIRTGINKLTLEEEYTYWEEQVDGMETTLDGMDLWITITKL